MLCRAQQVLPWGCKLLCSLTGSSGSHKPKASPQCSWLGALYQSAAPEEGMQKGAGWKPTPLPPQLQTRKDLWQRCKGLTHTGTSMQETAQDSHPDTPCTCLSLPLGSCCPQEQRPVFFSKRLPHSLQAQLMDGETEAESRSMEQADGRVQH